MPLEIDNKKENEKPESMDDEMEIDELEIQSEIENIMEKVDVILKKIKEAYPKEQNPNL